MTTSWLLLASEATAGGAEHHVHGGVTFLFALLLAAMIAALAFEEKLHAKKSIIVGAFAGICLLLATGMNLLSFEGVLLPGGYDLPKHLIVDGAEPVKLPVYIPSIDWGVITIILGASLFVEVTSRSGLFTWMAIKCFGMTYSLSVEMNDIAMLLL